MKLWNDIPSEATIVEVAPRDGLQNEQTVLKTDDKIQFIELLGQAGVNRMEVTAFVREDKVPQMKDAPSLSAQLNNFTGEAIGLVPNQVGFDKAIQCGLKSLALVTATSETFNRKNINMGIQESLVHISDMTRQARKKKIKLRAHLSTSFGCPYEGTIPLEKVVELTQTLASLEIHEIALADTIGVATPGQVDSLLSMLSPRLGKTFITLHFHDTRGMAMANILTALNRGYTSFDASAGGIGGCPYAPGAGGNVATEELIYLFNHLGIKCGINLEKIFTAVEFIAKKLNPSPCYSKLFRAHQNRRTKS